jgi:hypothetical protein
MHAGRHDEVNSLFSLLIRTSLEIFNNMLVQFDMASHSTVKHTSPYCSSECSTMLMLFCDACAMPSCAILPWSCFHVLYLRQASQWEAGSAGGVASRRQISCVCGLTCFSRQWRVGHGSQALTCADRSHGSNLCSGPTRAYMVREVSVPSWYGSVIFSLLPTDLWVLHPWSSISSHELYM